MHVYIIEMTQITVIVVQLYKEMEKKEVVSSLPPVWGIPGCCSWMYYWHSTGGKTKQSKTKQTITTQANNNNKKH